MPTRLSSSPPRRDRVILVDPSVLGQSHLLVNLGMVRLCSELFADVDVVADKEHCDALRSYGGEAVKKVRFHGYVSRKEVSVPLLQRLDPDCSIIFLNLDYRIFWRVMRRRQMRSRFIRWTLHSHFASDSGSHIRQIKGRIRKFLLFELFSSAKYLVYGETIRRSLLELLDLPSNSSRVAPVVHPVGLQPFIPECEVEIPGAVADRSRALTVSVSEGWHRRSSESDDVISKLQDACTSNDQLHFLRFANNVARREDGSKVLSQDYADRVACMGSTDLVLFIPNGNYSLQASGALMDTFVIGRPVLGLMVDFAQEIFDLVGPIGFLFETTHELETFIRNFSPEEHALTLDSFRRNLGRGHSIIMERALCQLTSALLDSD